MKCTSLAPFACLVLGGAALAQQSSPVSIRPATPAKYAGIYHVATDTWTRSASPVAQIGVDVLYDNTCVGAVYRGLAAGESLIDSGRLPSTSSPTSATSLTGTANSYLVDGMDMFYCTGESVIDIQMAFYDCYSPCADASALTPTAVFDFLGAPGTVGTTGSLACWIITVDLAATTLAFNLAADCDGTYDADPTLDNFGWSYEQITPPASGVPGGPASAGDPFSVLGSGQGSGCPYGDGTVWGGDLNTDGFLEGTGIGSDDVFEVDLGGSMTGCLFFGGYLQGSPYSSFALRLFGDAASGPVLTGTAFCHGDGAGTACPCGNNNDNSVVPSGCANSVSTAGATLSGAGNPSIANDTVLLSTTGLAPNQPGLYFRADNAINGGNGIIFGDGLRCAGGNVSRMEVRISDGAGTSSTTVSMGAGLSAGTVRRYQCWYRDPAGSPCGAAFNLSNGFEITWSL